MAAAGYTPISLYYSTTGAAVPVNTNLVNGELAINITDGKLYYKDNSNVVQLLASKAGASGDVVGPASATDNAIARYDLTTGKLIQNSGVTVDDSNNLTLPGQADLRFADSDSSNWVAFQAPATVASNVTWTLPNTDGTNGYALVTNGSGTLSWATVGGVPGGSTTEIQFNNSGSFGGSANFTWDGTNVQLGATGALRFADTDSSNYVAFKAPGTISSNVTWTLPSADGSSGQFLSTNGTGTLSWATASGGGGGGGTSVTVTQITATASQTTFNVTYTVGQISVYLNGALLASADYTATNGTTVVLATGAAANDIFTAVVYSSVTQIIQGDTSVAVSDSGSNGTITFTTDNSERARFTSAGLLLINQTTDQAGCLVDVSRTTDALFSASRFVATTGSASFYFNKSRGASVGTNTIVQADDSLGVIYWRGANGTGYTEGAYIAGQVDGTPGASNDMPGRLVFATTADGSGSPTERMRISADGTIKTSSTISVGGATPSTSGAGITFPATQSASSNANTLDDYEEGTWTPTVRGESSAGTTTYTTQLGYYTKIGNTVHLYCNVAYSAATGTGTLQIQGVPFNNVDRVTMGAVRMQDVNLPNTSTWIVTAFQDTSGTITFNGSGDDVGVTEVALSNESAGIIFQITYRV